MRDAAVGGDDRDDDDDDGDDDDAVDAANIIQYLKIISRCIHCMFNQHD